MLQFPELGLKSEASYTLLVVFHSFIYPFTALLQCYAACKGQSVRLIHLNCTLDDTYLLDGNQRECNNLDIDTLNGS